MSRGNICCYIFIASYFASACAMNLVAIRHNHCTIDEECVSLKSCNSYLNVLKATKKPLKAPVVNFLRQKECGFEDGYPKLCCPSFSKTNNATDPKENDYATCKAKTKCIPIKKCQAYIVFLHKVRKPLNSFVVQFLRSRQCGYEKDYPLVCCSPVPNGYDFLGQLSLDVSNGFKKVSSEVQSSSTTLQTTENTTPRTSTTLRTTTSTTPRTTTTRYSTTLRTTTSTIKPIKKKKYNEKADIFERYFQMRDLFDIDPFFFRRK